jgi:uncharacterized lipoprotein YajG
MNLRAISSSPAGRRCYDGHSFVSTTPYETEKISMLKKFIFPLLAMFVLAGCATSSNTLEVSPKIKLPQQDPGLMGVTVSINGADQRRDQALAKINRDGQLVTLTPSRDLRFLLQDPFLIDQMSYERPTSLSGEILPKV